ncbi:MAG: hypothetical protein ABWK53_02605 [Anaerolineales bacterium]
MNTPDPLAQPERRAVRYWYVDGSYEIGLGLLCLLLSLYFLTEKLLEGSRFSALVDGGLVLVFALGILLVNWLTRRIKEGVTYPRTGYVAYRRPAALPRLVRLLLLAVISGLVAAAIALLVTRPFAGLDVMPLVSGLLLAFVFAILAWRSSVPRFYLLAVFSALAGLGLAFSGLGNYLALSAYYAAIGLALILSGLLTLLGYLRQNPAP